MAKTNDPIQGNSEGLECFANGDTKAANALLKGAYRNLSEEIGILVNLGLTLMQQGLVDQAERAYRLALHSDERRVRRSAAKNLGFLLLWRGEHQEGWHWHGRSWEDWHWHGLGRLAEDLHFGPGLMDWSRIDRLVMD